MVNVKVFFKEEKMGPCGQIRDYAEYAVHKGIIDLLKDDCIEMMEDYETGVEDSFRIVFTENDIVILEIINIDDIWHRYQLGELIVRDRDYAKIFV